MYEYCCCCCCYCFWTERFRFFFIIHKEYLICADKIPFRKKNRLKMCVLIFDFEINAWADFSSTNCLWKLHYHILGEFLIFIFLLLLAFLSEYLCQDKRRKSWMWSSWLQSILCALSILIQILSPRNNLTEQIIGYYPQCISFSLFFLFYLFMTWVICLNFFCLHTKKYEEMERNGSTKNGKKWRNDKKKEKMKEKKKLERKKRKNWLILRYITTNPIGEHPTFSEQNSMIFTITYDAVLCCVCHSYVIYIYAIHTCTKTTRK